MNNFYCVNKKLIMTWSSLKGEWRIRVPDTDLNLWIGDLLGVKVLINAFLVSIKEKWHIEKKTSIQYKSNNGINVIFSMFVSFIYYNACIFFFLKKQWKFWPNIIYLSTQWFAHSTGMQVTTQTKAINRTNQPLCQYL